MNLTPLNRIGIDHEAQGDQLQYDEENQKIKPYDKPEQVPHSKLLSTH